MITMWLAACTPKDGRSPCAFGTHEELGACVSDDVAETDADTDADADADADADSDTDTDTGPDPQGPFTRFASSELPQADATVRGRSPGDSAGAAIDLGGDFDGDGVADLLVTAYGPAGAYVVPGPIADIGLIELSFHVEASSDWNFGDEARWVGDVDGDGLDEFAVTVPLAAAPHQGGAFLVSGGGRGKLNTDELYAWWQSSTPDVPLHLTGGGDVTGDGLPDLVLSDSYATSVATNGGAIYVVSDPAAGASDVNDAYSRVYGATLSAQVGARLATLADFDGDGIDDIPAYNAGHACANGMHGAVVVYSGPIEGRASSDPSVVWEILDDMVDPVVQLSTLGDVGGDGHPDLLLCSAIGPNSVKSRCYVVPGGQAGIQSLELADATIVATTQNSPLTPASATGDVDDDGYGDVLIGEVGAAAHGASTGAAYLFYGPVSGSFVTTDATATIDGNREGMNAGNALLAGDANDDGIPDLLVSAIAGDGDYNGSGAVSVFTGE